MLDMQRSSTAGGESVSDGLARRRDRIKRSLVARRRKPSENELDAQRLVAGECTRGCGSPSIDGSAYCEPCGVRARAAAAKSVRELRRDRRARGLCVYCEVESETRRCVACSIKQGRIPVSRRQGVTEGVNRERIEQRVERDGTAGSGVTTGVRIRNRYAGRGGGAGRRGAPSRDQIEADDVRNLRFAIREAEKAIAALEFCATEAVQALPKIQREAARREALAPADLASRLIDETLDRNKYGQDAQLRLARRNRPR